ncbi:MAG TPA: ATP-binding protein [Pseudonocardia sp.]|nr:ATP-binding protein [Pseudonocardia sp.]
MWGHMHRWFTAAPTTPKAARQCISEWLHRLGWTGPEHDDVVLAVSEAITNAVEHAYPEGYPGVVTIDAATLAGPDGAQRIHLTVTDQGSWRDPGDGPVSVGSVPLRGRGLTMIRATMACLRLDTNASGTRLTMVSRAVKPRTHTRPSM